MGIGRPKISEDGRKKLNNSIAKIQINGRNGTGFFMKFEINKDTKYFLITLNQIISQEQIDSKINIDLFYDRVAKTIILDKNIRNIKTFENGVIIIEIIQNDEIPMNNFLFLDLNYKNGFSLNTRINSIGYNSNYTERQISSGEITLVNGSEFKVNLNAILGSPICTFDNQFVVGIYKGDNKGIFIGEILDSLQKENDTKINIIKYYYFDESKEKYILFNKNVLNQYLNQNEENFNSAFRKLEIYISSKNDNNLKNILDILQNFKIIENYDEKLKKILGVQGFLDKINNIIRADDNELSGKFYYFIGVFLNALEKSECAIRNHTQLFRGAVMNYQRLLEYQNNINKLIFYKGFCPATRERSAAAVFGRAVKNNDNYSVIEIINYKFQSGWKPYCFDISKYDTFRETKTALFTLYTCFKIKDVKIDKENKSAEILLDSVGIKMDINKKKISNIIYNTREEVLEVV